MIVHSPTHSHGSHPTEPITVDLEELDGQKKKRKGKGRASPPPVVVTDPHIADGMAYIPNWGLRTCDSLHAGGAPLTSWFSESMTPTDRADVQLGSYETNKNAMAHGFFLAHINALEVSRKGDHAIKRMLELDGDLSHTRLQLQDAQAANSSLIFERDDYQQKYIDAQQQYLHAEARYQQSESSFAQREAAAIATYRASPAYRAHVMEDSAKESSTSYLEGWNGCLDKVLKLHPTIDRAPLREPREASRAARRQRKADSLGIPIERLDRIDDAMSFDSDDDDGDRDDDLDFDDDEAHSAS